MVTTILKTRKKQLVCNNVIVLLINQVCLYSKKKIEKKLVCKNIYIQVFNLFDRYVV